MNCGIKALKRRRFPAVLLVYQGLVTVSLAQTPPSQLTNVPGASEIDLQPTTGLRLGTLQIEFEQTGLRTIGPEMHNVVIRHAQPKGDERGYSWLCFTAARDSHRERWWLMSDDALGGAPDYLITGVFVEQLAPTAMPTAACPAPPPQFLQASFDHQIWLGSPSGAIKSAFGSEPSLHGWFRYSNVRKQIDSNHGKPVEWEVHSWFDVKIADGVVVAVRAVQMSTT
jgi:hypothetical protein